MNALLTVPFPPKYHGRNSESFKT